MINGDLLKARFGQYGAAWLGTFLLVLVGDLAAGLARVPLAAAANLLLLASLIALAIAFAVFVAQTLLSAHNGATKTVLLVLGVILLLPLLWAPMLGAIASAYIGHVSIEYSSVYAGFRIVVGNVIFGIMTLFTRNPYLEAGFAVFQNLAVVVGFIASMAQLWQVFIAPGRRGAAEG